jgi:hypothetical protein
MEWLSAILAAFKAIPVISQDIRDIASFFRQAQENKWFEKLDETIKTLNKPTTVEAKDAAAKVIADSIKSL